MASNLNSQVNLGYTMDHFLRFHQQLAWRSQNLQSACDFLWRLISAPVFGTAACGLAYSVFGGYLVWIFVVMISVWSLFNDLIFGIDGVAVNVIECIALTLHLCRALHAHECICVKRCLLQFWGLTIYLLIITSIPPLVLLQASMFVQAIYSLFLATTTYYQLINFTYFTLLISIIVATILLLIQIRNWQHLTKQRSVNGMDRVVKGTGVVFFISDMICNVVSASFHFYSLLLLKLGLRPELNWQVEAEVTRIKNIIERSMRRADKDGTGTSLVGLAATVAAGAVLGYGLSRAFSDEEPEERRRHRYTRQRNYFQ